MWGLEGGGVKKGRVEQQEQHARGRRDRHQGPEGTQWAGMAAAVEHIVAYKQGMLCFRPAAYPFLLCGSPCGSPISNVYQIHGGALCDRHMAC
jgi:hypothetical protein